MTTTHGITLLAVLAVGVLLLLPTSPYMGDLGWGYFPSITLAVLAAILTLLILRSPSRGQLL
jgi:hypothetical protein